MPCSLTGALFSYVLYQRFLMFYVHVYDEYSESPEVCGPFSTEAEASAFMEKQTLAPSAFIVEAGSEGAAGYMGV